MSYINGANDYIDWVYIRGDSGQDGSVRVRYVNGKCFAESRVDGLWTRVYGSNYSGDPDIKTGDYTATVNDGVILADASAAAVTIYLPDVAEASGIMIPVKKINTTGYDVTVDGNGINIDGQSNIVLTGPTMPAIRPYSDGSQWLIF